MWVKTKLHQDKILLLLTCLPFSPPISLPLLIHTCPIPIPYPSRSHPTHLQPPAYSPLSVTPRTCSSVTLSINTTNLFSRLPVHSSTYNVTHRTCSSVTLSSTTINMFPSPLVPLSTSPVPCLLSHTTCSLVYSSTRQLTMLLIELVHLLPCLLSPPTCSPVPLSPVFLPCPSHLYPPLIQPFLVNYFYHLTFLSELIQNTATQILPFLSPTSSVENITINNTSH